MAKMICSSETGKCYPINDSEAIIEAIHDLESRMKKLEDESGTTKTK